jgi:3-hydroxyisobutyrate dehydrogenase
VSGPVVGFVGLGKMGAPMADRLQAGGYPLRVFDAVPGLADEFAADRPGVEAVDNVSGLAAAEIVILMLPSSDVVEAVVHGGLAEALRPGTLVVDMSSSDPVRTRKLAERLEGDGLRLVDAPVSGGVRGAVAGTLCVMAGGRQEDLDEVAPLLDHLAATVIQVGAVGSGHAAKALNNLVSAAGMSVTVEALRVAEAFGIDPSTMTTVLNASSGRSNTSENKVEQFMLSGTFGSGFTLALMAKDVRIALDLAHSLGQRSEVADQVEAQWSEVAASAGPQADHTEMYRLVGGPR